MMMADAVVQWTDEVDDVLRGDVTAALAYVTPAGGAVVTAVAPCGLGDRALGVVSFSTSLGFGRKLERIVRDPHAALAFHSREHGFSTSSLFVLMQGRAVVDLAPVEQRLDAFVPQATRYLGELKRGPIWDRLLHEYYRERVFVDVTVQRIVVWSNLNSSGAPSTIGAPLAARAEPQRPPSNGVRPRVDVGKAARHVAALPHRVLAYKGADGLPVIVPIEFAGHDERGLRLVHVGELLPPGGRRAGILAHAYRPQLIGIGTRVFTGWLDVDEDGSATYAPHTSRGFVAPPRKNLLLVTNGLMAKYGVHKARRTGLVERLTEAGARSGSS